MHVSNMRRAKRLVALAAGLSLVAMACGGDDDDDTTADDRGRQDEGTETTTARDRGASGHRGRPTDTTAAGGEAGEDEGAAPAGDDGDDDHRRPEPRCRVGGRHADHVGRPRVHLAGQLEHARARSRPPATTRSPRSQPATSDKQVDHRVLRAVRPVQDPVLHDHQGRLRRGLQRHLGRLRDRDADLRPPVHARGRGATNQSDPRPQRELLGRRPGGHRRGRDRAADRHRHRDRLDPGRSGRLHLSAAQRRARHRAAGREHRSSIENGGDYEALYFQQLEGPFADPVFREAFSHVDRPPGAVRPDLRADLRVGRRRRRAAELRPDRPRVRTARRTTSRTPTIRRRPRRC